MENSMKIGTILTGAISLLISGTLASAEMDSAVVGSEEALVAEADAPSSEVALADQEAPLEEVALEEGALGGVASDEVALDEAAPETDAVAWDDFDEPDFVPGDERQKGVANIEECVVLA